MFTMELEFNSQIQLGTHLKPDILNKTKFVKNEPMLFSCDKETAYLLGGPLTHAFLNQLNYEFCSSQHLIIDSRVHMLMPNWFPCIPGWHHDSVERSREDGQPNYLTASARTKHCMMLLSENNVCPTEFAIGKADFPIVPIGELCYKTWHPIVEEKCNNRELERWYAPFGQIIYFDDRTWHQGTKSKDNGWRWFIRASIDPTRKPTNELRRQVQVYLENPMEGW